MAQAFLIDTVADAGRDVPLGGDFQRRQSLRRMEYRLHGNHLVAVALSLIHI